MIPKPQYLLISAALVIVIVFSGCVRFNPASKPVCEIHSLSRCDSDHLYWFDSCGNREERKEYCANGCSNGACMQSTENCTNGCPQEGSRHCADNGYQVCGKYDSDSCLKWGATVSCHQDEFCSNGQCIYQHSELGSKIPVLESGPSEDKLDILFIPENITDMAEFRSKINSVLYKQAVPGSYSLIDAAGLFNTPPFTDYKDKFNVYYVDKNIDMDKFNCIFPQPNPPYVLFPSCNEERIIQEYGIFKPDYIVLVFDMHEGYSSYASKILFLNQNRPNNEWTFVHEFGHELGLVDEYVTTSSPALYCGYATDEQCFNDEEEAAKVYPNVDTLGCPKWCASYDLQKLIDENRICTEITNAKDCAEARNGGICTWFNLKHPFLNANCVKTQGAENIGINCEEGAQCIFGGNYGQLVFNPGGSSIMGGGSLFTKPSSNYLKSILNCCYPRKNTTLCNDFRNNLAYRPLALNKTIFPFFYDKIVNCGLN